MDQTNFETLLQQYFPDIYRLNQLAKSEAHLWSLLQLILENNTNQITGKIEISYTKGHIDGIKQNLDIIAFKAKRPGY
jgi:hypothetical protein